METRNFNDEKRDELGSHELGAVAFTEQLCMRREGRHDGCAGTRTQAPYLAKCQSEKRNARWTVVLLVVL